MAEVSYLKLKNTKTGTQVQGDCTEGKYKGWIQVQALEHEVSRPTHAQTGKVTGEAAYGALAIIKPLDESSPLLQQGLGKGHPWKGEIHFIRTADKGGKEHWFTISFDNATVVKMRTYKPSALEAHSDLPDLEEVQFRYEIMHWRHVTAKKEHKYDWKEKMSA